MTLTRCATFIAAVVLFATCIATWTMLPLQTDLSALAQTEMTVWLFLCGAAVFAAGSFIATFGLFSPTPGMFDYKRNLFGRFLKKVAGSDDEVSGARRFCETGFLFTLISIASGALGLAVVMTIFVKPAFILMWLAIGVAIGAVWFASAKYETFVQKASLVVLALIFVAIVGAIIYAIATGHHSHLTFVDFIPIGIIVGFVLILSVLKTFSERLGFYDRLCPIERKST